MAGLTEDDLAEVAESLASGDRKQAGFQLIGVLATAATGHPIIGGIAAGAMQALASAIGNSAEKRMIGAGKEWDNEQERVRKLRELLLTLLQPILEEHLEKLSEQARSNRLDALRSIRESVVEEAAADRLALEGHARTLTDALDRIEEALVGSRLREFVLEIRADGSLPRGVLAEAMDSIAAATPTRLRFSYDPAVRALSKSIDHSYAVTGDEGVAQSLRLFEDELQDLSLKLPAAVAWLGGFDDEGGLGRDGVIGACGRFAQLVLSDQILRLACCQLPPGLPMFEAYIRVPRESEGLDRLADLVCLHDGKKADRIVGYRTAQRAFIRPIWAPDNLGYEWLYLVSPTDDGQHLRQTTHRFLVNYAYPQYMWRERDFAKRGRPSLDPKFPASGAEDRHGKILTLSGEEQQRRMQARAASNRSPE